MRLQVFCGAGNNAGDGYVLAALAAQRCLAVEVLQVGDPGRLAGDALAAYEFARQEGVTMTPWSATATLTPGVLVDALLGTGLKGEVRENYAAAIAQVNDSGLPVLALDLPSGLCSDTGRELGCAVRAQMTMTFIGLKRGLVTGRGPALVGSLRFDDLQVPAAVYDAVAADVDRLALADQLPHLTPRAGDAHKGDFGHVMIIGGDSGYGGAAALAAEASARMGAGLVSVATRPEHVAAILARRPELMVAGVTSGQALEPLLERPSVLVIGPGLGQSPWSEQMLQQAAKTGLPMVVDADALNLIAAGRLLADRGPQPQWIVTPHPGEAARLLHISTAEVQADRFAAAQALEEKLGTTVILKGAGSVVASGNRLAVCTAGNPGMASGGMGDLLSGILGALLAQGLPVAEAATLGVCLHSAAADRAAAQSGQRGLLATDLLAPLRELLNS